MGLYRTAIVQGLSIEHGRGERRQFSPVKTEVISITLKDNNPKAVPQDLAGRWKVYKR